MIATTKLWNWLVYGILVPLTNAQWLDNDKNEMHVYIWNNTTPKQCRVEHLFHQGIHWLYVDIHMQLSFMRFQSTNNVA